MCGGSYEHISLFDERHEKIDLESLLLSYQKEEGRAWQRPSFFWYDNDKDRKVCFLVTQLI